MRGIASRIGLIANPGAPATESERHDYPAGCTAIQCRAMSSRRVIQTLSRPAVTGKIAAGEGEAGGHGLFRAADSRGYQPMARRGDARRP